MIFSTSQIEREKFIIIKTKHLFVAKNRITLLKLLLLKDVIWQIADAICLYVCCIQKRKQECSVKKNLPRIHS